MTTQTSLLEGDALAQYRFSLQAIVQDRIADIRRLDHELPAVYDAVLLQACRELGQAADELRRIGPDDDGVPF